MSKFDTNKEKSNYNITLNKPSKKNQFLERLLPKSDVRLC